MLLLMHYGLRAIPELQTFLCVCVVVLGAWCILMPMAALAQKIYEQSCSRPCGEPASDSDSDSDAEEEEICGPRQLLLVAGRPGFDVVYLDDEDDVFAAKIVNNEIVVCGLTPFQLRRFAEEFPDEDLPQDANPQPSPPVLPAIVD